MDIKLISLFNAALSDEKKLDFAVVNAEAMKRGYLVHQDACTESALEFVKSRDINYNATFYKEWNDVVSKTRFELFLDQLLHYMTTYGTDFALGNGYVPNEGAENVPLLKLENYKVILPITREELFERCMSMLKSGIALSNATLTPICDFVVTAGMPVDVDSIKNREALVQICDRLHIYPSQSINLFRFILYKTLGNALIIKNDDTIRSIKCSHNIFDFRVLNDNQIITLSEVFYRFKPLFLAFKQGNRQCNGKIINKIRKLANEHHKPMITPFWNNVLSVFHTEEEIREHLEEITNFKKVTLMQTISEYLGDLENNLYLVRNGRIFIKPKEKSTNEQRMYWMMVYSVLRRSLVDMLREKATYCKFPEGCTITCPTSEKNFVGNYPIGSSFDLSDDNYIGIYWRNEWGTHDFDLSMIIIEGGKIGWNSVYYNEEKSIVYSGDMTNAEPDASEVIYCRGTYPEGIVKVNRYNGISGSKFQCFLGVENDVNNIKRGYNNNRGYMVDPNTIKFNIDLISEDAETTVGVVSKNKFYLTDLKTGKGIVSRNNSKILPIAIEKLRYYIPLRDLLLEAGFKEFNPNEIVETIDTDGNVLKQLREWKDEYLDFTDLSKDTLISLFS